MAEWELSPQALLAVAAEAFAAPGTPIKAAAAAAAVAVEDDEEEREPVLHLVPQLRVRLTADAAQYTASRPTANGRHVRVMPPVLYLKHQLDDLGQPAGMTMETYDVAVGTLDYVPHLYVDELWLQQRYYRPLDPAAAAVNVSVILTPSSRIQVATYRTLHEALQLYMKMGFTSQDLDDVKDICPRPPGAVKRP